MSTNHYAVTALPTNDDANKALLRSGLWSRNPYCLTTAEDSRDFIAVDPSTGAIIPAFIQNNKLYGYDSTDTTTAHDGVVCLVSNEGKRYKLEDLSTPFSVLDKDLLTPVASPSPAIGDTYLIYGTPTGAWAGKSGYITVYTARGWEFCLPSVGFRVYVEDEDAFYYRDLNGDWIAGLGSVSVGDDTIPLSALIWDWRVENQTTNDPPSSWSKGTAYIIATPTVSPSNHWTGNSLKLAIAESDGVLANGDTFTIYTPWDGLEVYDKSQKASYRWSSTSSTWRTAFSGYGGVSEAEAASAATITASGADASCYLYSATTAPTSTNNKSKIIETLTHVVTADVAGQEIEVEYHADVSTAMTTTLVTDNNVTYMEIIVGLFIDSETDARDWQRIFYRRQSLGTLDQDKLAELGNIRTPTLKATLAAAGDYTVKIILFPGFYRVFAATISTLSVGLARRHIIARKRA